MDVLRRTVFIDDTDDVGLMPSPNCVKHTGKTAITAPAMSGPLEGAGQLAAGCSDHLLLVSQTEARTVL